MYSVAYSPDGKHIVTGSRDNTVKVWDSQTGKEVWTSSCHNGRKGCICEVDEDDMVTLNPRCTLTAHSREVLSVAYSPDGKHLVSGSADKTVKVWDSQTGKEECTLTGHSGYVRSVAYSPDGKHIVSGSADKTVKVWDSQTGKEVRVLVCHRPIVCCCVH